MNLLLYQFIDSIESVRPTLPPTPRPRRVCAGSAITVESALLEAAEAHHGGDSCVLWEFLGSCQNLIAVKLLTSVMLCFD